MFYTLISMPLYLLCFKEKERNITSVALFQSLCRGIIVSTVNFEASSWN